MAFVSPVEQSEAAAAPQGPELGVIAPVNPLCVEDILIRIFEFLPTRTVLRLSATCRLWNSVCREDNSLLWRSVWNTHTNYSTIAQQQPTHYLNRTYKALCSYKVFTESKKWNGLNLPDADHTLAPNVDNYKDGFICKYNMLNAADGPIELSVPQGPIVRIMISDTFITAVSVSAFHVYHKDRRHRNWRMDCPFVDEETGQPEAILNFWVYKDVVVVARLSASNTPLNSITVYDLRSLCKYFPNPHENPTVHPAVHRDTKTGELIKMELLATGNDGETVIYDLNRMLEVVRSRRLRSSLSNLAWGSIHESGMVLFISKAHQKMEFLWDMPGPDQKTKGRGRLSSEGIRNDLSETSSSSASSTSALTQSQSDCTPDGDRGNHFRVRQVVKSASLEDPVIDVHCTDTSVVLHQYGMGNSVYNKPHARVRVFDVFTGEFFMSTHFRTHVYALALRLADGGVVYMDAVSWQFMFRSYQLHNSKSTIKLGDLFVTVGNKLDVARPGGTGRDISRSRTPPHMARERRIKMSSVSSTNSLGKATKFRSRYDEDELQYWDYDDYTDHEVDVDEAESGGDGEKL
ncbi:hypothetical protein SeLEV6574_g03202 [Synchytrium endobioticum]|uniref:F-box domain-containing protein n=1 Tax=Synchytrium endobioticum TaxID=286115 RepID=A0A507D4T6_9FUNG|nr:hypothetical protein SeLEV6574_g03202 [Synchytrium endobioticum]